MALVGAAVIAGAGVGAKVSGVWDSYISPLIASDGQPYSTCVNLGEGGSVCKSVFGVGGSDERYVIDIGTKGNENLSRIDRHNLATIVDSIDTENTQLNTASSCSLQ